MDEVVEHMLWSCREIVHKLRRADEKSKREFDTNKEFVSELNAGDQVLVQNRKSGSLEPKLVGPFTFVRYKDYDKYAVILKDDDEHEFDCAASHLVPL